MPEIHKMTFQGYTDKGQQIRYCPQCGRKVLYNPNARPATEIVEQGTVKAKHTGGFAWQPEPPQPATRIDVRKDVSTVPGDKLLKDAGFEGHL